MSTKPKILIIGAGIGGLMAAITLRAAGFVVEVYERAAGLREAGAGIGLSPNATRVLKQFGLLQYVLDRGTAVEAAVSYTCGGREISRLSTNRMEVPMVCLHRADLQQALLSAVPPECIHLGEQFLELT